jgi:FkbM family methyltransferase
VSLLVQIRAQLSRAGALTAPRRRLLPGLGARLGRHPRLAAAVLTALRRLPGWRLRAVAYRSLSLPLAERLATRLEIPVSDGLRMVVDTSDVLGRTLATSGIWEPQTTAAFRSLLGEGDVCVDVGANVGYYTLLASRLVGPSGHVYALEPAPEIYAALQANLALNAVSNVTALPVAAGPDEGRAALFRPPSGNVGRSSLRPHSDVPSRQDRSPVAVRPLAAVVRGSDLHRLRLVKIDVEGYEVEVLRGLEPILGQGLRPAVLVEVHTLDAPEAPDYLTRLCADYGLKAYTLVHDFGLHDRRFSPAILTHSPLELEPTTDFASIPTDRYDLLLTGE